MSAITADMLREHIADMQRVVIAHNGAIEYAEKLLSIIEVDDSGMPVGEFAQMVGGNGAQVESIEAVQ